MNTETNLWKRFINHPLTPKVVALVVIALALWFLKPMFNLIIMTMFLTTLTYQLTNMGHKYLHLPRPVSIIIIYTLILGSVGFLFYHFWHQALQHANEGLGALIGFYSAKPHTPIKMFDQAGIISAHTQYQLLGLFQQFHINEELAGIPKLIFKHLPEISQFGVDIILAFALSFVINIELPTLHKFADNFYDSQISSFFKTTFGLMHQFFQSFSIAISTQLIIACVNTFITTIGLGILHYDNLWLLAMMVWVLSLVPVLGALISFIPLAIIGFAHGGIYDVIMVALLLICVHALESYVLNPQLMANRTQLPIAYTFVALIFGDMYLGVWGLLLAVPLLTFTLDFLDVKSLPKPKLANKLKDKIKKDKTNPIER